MNTPCIWVERRFDCRIDPQIQVNILDRLAGVAARIEEKVAGLSQEKLNFKPDGKWSIKEHIGHLVDLEELWKMRIGDFLHERPLLSAWDVTNRKSVEANHNSREIGELLASFRSERREILRDFSALPSQALDWEAQHPRLKIPMKIADYSYFVAEHDDHHVTWIEWIRRA